MSQAIDQAARQQIAHLRARIIVLEGRSPVPLTLPPGEGFAPVLKAVAGATGVTMEDMLGEGRSYEIALARHMAMALARKLLGYSLPRIGRLLRRDHTTVLHGLRRIARECEGNPDFAARLDRLAADIRQQQKKERAA